MVKETINYKSIKFSFKLEREGKIVLEKADALRNAVTNRLFSSSLTRSRSSTAARVQSFQNLESRISKKLHKARGRP